MKHTVISRAEPAAAAAVRQPSVIAIEPTALYSTQALAKAMQLDDSTCRRLLRDHREILRPATIGRRRYVLGSDFLAFVESRRESA